MTYWARIVGSVHAALIVENYAFVGYAAPHSVTRPASRQVILPRERSSPRTPTTAARCDRRRAAVEPPRVRGRQRRETRAVDRRWPAGDLQPYVASRLRGESREH